MSVCTGTTKKGAPCKARPLTGKPTCLAHADEETRASLGFGGPENGAKGGVVAKPRMVDMIRERLEAELDEWWQVAIDARDAKRAVVVGNGPSAYLAEVADHSTRLAAFREILDRSYGRPKQQTEITGADGGPVELVDVRRAPGAVAGVLAQAGVRPPGDA